MLILTAVTAAAYINALHAPFLLDDKELITQEPLIKPPVSLSGLLSHYRPAVAASLALNYKLGELQVTGYHVLNLVAHILCGIVFWFFARRTLLEPVFAGRYEKAANFLALAAAGIFLLHPIQTESVTYTVQRAEIFVSIALLASLWLAAVAARAGSRWRASPGLIAIGIFGMFSKELFVVVPVLFVLYDWCFIAEGRLEHIKRRWPLYSILGLLAVTATVRGFALNAQYDTTGFGIEGIDPWRYLTWQFGVVLYYIRLILVPNQLCFDCGFYGPWPVLHSPLGDSVLFPAIALATIGVIAWLAGRWMPLLTFAILGSGIVLAPTSTFVPLMSPYVEHRLYLSIAFVSLLLVTAAYDLSGMLIGRFRLPPTFLRVLRVSAVVAIWAGLGWLTTARNDLYTDPLRLLQDTVTKAPENSRAQFNLANAYKRSDQPEEAIDHYLETIRLVPESARAYVNLGLVYQNLGRYEAAAETWERGVEQDPDLALLRRNLASLYLRLGRPHESAAMAERAVELQPRSFRGRKLLAQAYDTLGRPAESLEQYREAARLNPRDTDVKRRIEILENRRR